SDRTAVQQNSENNRSGSAAGPRRRGTGTGDEGQGQAGLVLVLALLVGVAGAADRVGAEEEDLGDALAGVDLGRQGRGVADLDGPLAAPLRLQGRYIHDDPATRVR